MRGGKPFSAVLANRAEVDFSIVCLVLLTKSPSLTLFVSIIFVLSVLLCLSILSLFSLTRSATTRAILCAIGSC